MEETKIIYHIDEENAVVPGTPYLVKVPVPPNRIRLIDFKNVLNRPNYKFFFKSMDDDFGEVKEEIVDDEAPLPCFNGRAVSWLVSNDGSDSNSQNGSCAIRSLLPLEQIGRPLPRGLRALAKPEDLETDSMMSSRQGYSGAAAKLLPLKGTSRRHHQERIYNRFNYDSSVMSSDTSTFVESEDDASSRITATTDHSSVSRVIRHNNMMRQQKRTKHKPVAMSRTSSFSSITESTMSLNIITVHLDMSVDDPSINFLGISIVGETNMGGDGGIYVGTIVKGGAVAKDGRIQPGDMILQVNDVDFQNMDNDEAVRALKEVVSSRGPIKLVVAKCWDPDPKGYLTIPRTEPVRPIDPGAWVAHTAAAISGRSTIGIGNMDGNQYLRGAASVSTLSSGSLTSSAPDTERTVEENGPIRLTTMTPMSIVVREMQKPDSGLEIRDRTWLKITVPNACIGSEIVNWLLKHVEGFSDRREAKKYAANLLKANLLRHTVNKLTFSDQCYYVFDPSIMQLPPISHLTLNSTSDHSSQLPLYTPCYDIYSYPTNQHLSESNSSGRSEQLLVDHADTRSNHSSGIGCHLNNGRSLSREGGSLGEVFLDAM